MAWDITAKHVAIERNDAGAFTYDFSFADGPGAWRNWMAPTVVRGDTGVYSDFTRIHVAGDLDANHIDGIGPIWLLSHLSLPSFGSPGWFDLSDATIDLTIRSHDLDANGASLYFWIIRYLPESDVVANYYVGLQSTNWAFTGRNLLDDLGEEWSTISVTLTADPTNWTYAGNNHSGQGDWAERYVEYPIADTLVRTDATIHLVFVGESPDKRPTGFVDIADISITTQAPANPYSHSVDQVIYGTEDEVEMGVLDLPPGFDPNSAQFALVDGAAVYGSVVIDPASGMYTLTPGANFWGPDRNGTALTFSYTVSDATHAAVTRKVYAYIAPVNDAPTPHNSNEDFTLEFGQQVTMTLRKAVDVDVGDRATYSIDPATVQHGLVDLDAASGRYTFTPEEGFSGVASFQYTVTDGLETSTPKTVSVTVLNEGESYIVPGIVQLTDRLLAGDYDGFVNGIIRLAGSGDVNAAYHLGTRLHYGRDVSQDTRYAAELLTRAVGTVADASYQLGDMLTQGDGVAKDYAAARALYEALAWDAKANYRLGVLDDLGFGGPVDPVAAVNHYLSGALLGDGDAMYTLGRRYLAASGTEYQADDAYFWLGLGLRYNGGPPSDSFRSLLNYNLGQAASDLAPARIADLDAAIAVWTPGNPTVVNDAPAPNPLSENFVFDYGRSLEGTLLAGTDRDGNSLSFLKVAEPTAGGAVTIDPSSGKFVFVPERGFVGLAQFSYQLSDGQDLSDAKAVSLEVRAITFAENDEDVTTEASTVIGGVSLLSNDLLDVNAAGFALTSVGGDPNNIGTEVAGAYGTLVVAGDGTYRYIANAPQLIEGQTVLDSFTYTVTDDLGTQSTAVLTITLNGVAGTVLTGAGRLVGSVFDDVISGSQASDQLEGLAGNDLLDGRMGRDILIGGAGDDVLVGGDGEANEMYGGLGDDTYIVSAVGDTLVEFANEGTDTVQTALSSFTLKANIENLTYTGNGTLTATGNELANTITGGAGNDVLIGGGGNDRLVGGAGIDTVIYAGVGAGVVVSLNTGDTSTDGDGGRDTLTSIETVIGSDFDDLIVGDAAGNRLEGGLGRDILIGGAGNDVLVGGIGVANQLQGGLGHDTYVVAVATDTLVEFANEGTDTVQTALSSFTLKANFENLTYTGNGTFTGGGNELANTITGGAGNDVLDGRAGADRMEGGAGDDRYMVDNAGDVVVELANGGTDTVLATLAAYTLGANIENLTYTGNGTVTGTGNELANTIIGGAGNDLLDGRAGADRMEGGAGDDRYMVDNAGDVVVELANGGTDTVLATLAAYTLGANIESLTYIGSGPFTGVGNELANTIIGGAGEDVLIGGGGNDRLVGGAGIDSVSYAGAGAGVVVSLNTGDTSTDGDGGRDTLTSIENVIGSDFDDLIVGDVGDNRLEGGLGRDILIGGAGNDVLVGGIGVANQLQGGLGDDTYVVAVATDTLVEFANEGTDTVQTALSSFTLKANIENLTYTGNGTFTGVGNELANTIIGGAGNDVLIGGGGNDRLVGGAGIDTVSYAGVGAGVVVSLNTGDTSTDGDGGRDTLASIENVIGSDFDDLIVGDVGDNRLEGGLGRDILIGGAGSDVLVGGTGVANQLQGGQGDDTYIVSVATDTLVEFANEGTDTVQTALSSFTLKANIENLTYTGNGNGTFTGTGNELANTITGGAGNDILSGAAGNDTLIGGAGSDRLTGGTGADKFVLAAGEGGVDQVTDFEAGVDKLLVSSAQFTPGNAFTFTTDPGEATTGPTFLYDQASGTLSFDADGSGGEAAVAIAQLAPFLNLTANDFGFY